MEVGAIRQFITHLWKLYASQTSKAAKAKVVDAVVITLQCHRKSAIRLLSGSTAPELRRKSGNRKPTYNQEDEKWLVRIKKLRRFAPIRTGVPRNFEAILTLAAGVPA